MVAQIFCFDSKRIGKENRKVREIAAQVLKKNEKKQKKKIFKAFTAAIRLSMNSLYYGHLRCSFSRRLCLQGL